ncbi:probable LRR receptor-like serine/threonine-protein kinase At3g47570 [Prosopis cineraria]|uniref:probable LRR receptor-like serine/threonine-protein kinase At3g47570 n=1 Tax=Prosopis cineraria TaxID=364024 RepID=UPI0024107F58|nr:probable LRR receptor-like serine/threonine-protein kinase At3g47570 [Prosopis cineraria]
MVNGSLEKWLHPNPNNTENAEYDPRNLLLDQILNVLIDVSSALHYLHYECNSNKQSNTIGIKGTVGYVPPEYGMGFEVSRQGEMYSFGILVLEMLTDRRLMEDMFKDGQNIHEYVKRAFPDKLLQIDGEASPLLLNGLEAQSSLEAPIDPLVTAFTTVLKGSCKAQEPASTTALEATPIITLKGGAGPLNYEIPVVEQSGPVDASIATVDPLFKGLHQSP